MNLISLAAGSKGLFGKAWFELFAISNHDLGPNHDLKCSRCLARQQFQIMVWEKLKIPYIIIFGDLGLWHCPWQPQCLVKP